MIHYCIIHLNSNTCTNREGNSTSNSSNKDGNNNIKQE